MANVPRVWALFACDWYLSNVPTADLSIGLRMPCPGVIDVARGAVRDSGSGGGGLRLRSGGHDFYDGVIGFSFAMLDADLDTAGPRRQLHCYGSRDELRSRQLSKVA
jgi:hypothetical protein